MIKRFKRRPEQKRFYRTNEQISFATLRVLDSDGKQIGILSKWDALTKARSAGLDLVEITNSTNPPIAKIIDFKKFLYQESKKKREEKRKAKVSETKEVRLGPFMNDHDLGVMIKRAKGFLEDGDKVRLVLKFIGRQIVHPEFGKNIVNKVISELSGIAKTERDMHFEGKNLIAILSPEKKKNKQTDETKTETKHEEKNEKIGA